MANNVDPDPTSRSEVSDLGLHSLFMSVRVFRVYNTVSYINATVILVQILMVNTVEPRYLELAYFELPLISK